MLGYAVVIWQRGAAAGWLGSWWRGGAAGRWRGGAVVRWRGGAVARWRGGAVARWGGEAVHGEVGCARGAHRVAIPPLAQLLDVISSSSFANPSSETPSASNAATFAR